jgi:hypothetical protein
MDKWHGRHWQFLPLMTQIFRADRPILRLSYYRDATDVARTSPPRAPSGVPCRIGSAHASKGGPEASAAGMPGRHHKVLNWWGLLAIWWTVEADPGITCHERC